MKGGISEALVDGIPFFYGFNMEFFQIKIEGQINNSLFKERPFNIKTVSGLTVAKYRRFVTLTEDQKNDLKSKLLNNRQKIAF